MSMILRAAALAREAHEGQLRKYTKRPYIEHPARVAGKVAILPGATDSMVAAAFLHDVLEDTEIDHGRIVAVVGPIVADLVTWLTNPSKDMRAPRQERKSIDREHLAMAPQEVKVIKLIDRIDNLLEMGEPPAGFKILYAEESIQLATVIGNAHPALADDLVNIARNLTAPR